MSKLQQLIDELCPDGVEFKKIENICDVKRGRVISKEDLRSETGEYPVYSSQTENNGILGYLPTYDYNGEYVTWTTDGANAGTVFYRYGKFSITNICGLLKAKEEISTKFLAYVLGLHAKKHVHAGAGNPKLMSNVMRRIEIPIPPLEVQNEIVRILDTFTELTAELTAELEGRKKQYEYYENKILFNPNYSRLQLKEVCAVNQGLQIPISKRFATKSSKRFFYITIQFLKGSAENYYIENPPESAICKAEDILVTRTGSTGQIVTGVDGCFHNNFFKVTPNEKVHKKFLYYVLKSRKIFLRMLNVSSGGTVPDLPHGKFYKIEIPVPNLDVQLDIIRKMDTLTQLIDNWDVGLPAEIYCRKEQYEYYRDEILNFD